MSACLYYPTYGASPGEQQDYGAEEALALYHEVQQHGWETVLRWRSFSLSDAEKEALWFRVTWLQQHLPDMVTPR